MEQWAAQNPRDGPGTYRYERARAVIEAREARAQRLQETPWMDRPIVLLTRSNRPIARYTNGQMFWMIVGSCIVLPLIGALLAWNAWNENYAEGASAAITALAKNLA